MGKNKLNSDAAAMRKRAFSAVRGALPPLLIAAAAVAVYADTFNASFHLDDFQNIVGNPAIRDIGDLRTLLGFNNRRFVGFLTFALNYRINGLELFGWHAVNLAIHIAAAWVVRLLVVLLFSTPALERSPLSKHRHGIAFWCALLFAVHPVQTQAVTYIVQRFASLAALFYLSAAALYVKGRLTEGIGRFGFFAASIAAGFLGLFTKENVATLPFAAALIEIFFFRFRTKVREVVVRPRFWAAVTVVGGVFLAAMRVILPNGLRTVLTPAASQRYGDPMLTPTIYFITQFRVIAVYIRLLFLPVGQNLDHDIPASTGFFEPAVLTGAFLAAAAFVAAVLLYRKNRAASFGIAWFFLTLSVESSLKPLGNVMFEHRLYLPFFGFGLCTVSEAYRLFAAGHRRILRVALAALMCILAVAAFRRNAVWRNEITLWRDAADKSPDKARPLHNLGLAYQRAGDYSSAAEAYRAALKRNPNAYETHLNLGMILARTGRTDEATRHYRRAIDINPNAGAAFINLGSLLLSSGDPDRAEGLLRKAVELDPESATARYNLGNALVRTGRYVEAEKTFKDALDRDPDNPDLLNNLGTTLLRLGRSDEAIKYITQATALKPAFAEAYNNLGLAFSTCGRYDEAVDAFSKALELNGTLGRIHRNIADVYLKKELPDSAAAHLERAAELAPEDAEAPYRLGLLYRDAGLDSLAV
ncbi:MAG: tetratricopeptide repeat protein, partial [Candidatus Latescibacteria bacterium]|nr:tetratricopeptide repeat protein [Candidatus Latescibacterota bacterium]